MAATLPTSYPLGFTLPVSKGNNGYFGTTTSILAQVQTNLTNLLLTTLGERVMQPTFGCNLKGVLFNNQTDDGLAEITATIQQSVQTWMPFVQVTSVQVNQDPDDNAVYVIIAFTLLTAKNITSSIILQF